MKFDETYMSLLENETFLMVCYGIFGVMLFCYLYTAMLICEQGGCSKMKKKSCNKQENDLPEICPSECGNENWLIATGIVESPVNINECNRNYTLDKLNWKHHDKKPKDLILGNNGESLTLRGIYDCFIPSVCGANLPFSYNYVTVTFRWGLCNKSGSDHMLNGISYPLEMHILYRPDNSHEVVSTSEMLIIAFLFEIREHNKNLDAITRYLKRVRLSCSKTKLKPFSLSRLIPMHSSGFYCYIGTMTMPPYYRGVRWLVYSKPLAVSEAQMREFRQLLDEDLRPIRKRGRAARVL